MPTLRLALASVALAAVACWNALVVRLGDAVADTPPPADVATHPKVVEHEWSWADYLRGYHVHVGDGDGSRPESGSLRDGLATWWATDCMRGYTRGDHVYLCPNAPTVVRVHQAGHAPAFGREFEPLRTERRDDGGLEDEPLRTLDVMLPGRFPHSLLRLRDPRGLRDAYARWVESGRVARR